MTVCIVTDSFPPDLGGIATFYGNLSSMLIASGHKVIVMKVDLDADVADDDLLIQDGLMTVVILKKSFIEKYNYYRKFFRPGGLNAPAWISAGLTMRDWLLKNTELYDINIIDVTDYGGMGVFFCHPELPPVAVTGHGTLTQYSKINHVNKDDHYKVIIRLEQLSFKFAAIILSYSPANQSDLKETFNRTIDFSTAPWIKDELIHLKTNTSGLPLVVAGVQKIKGAELLTQALKDPVAKDLYVEWIGIDFYTAPGGTSMAGYMNQTYSDVWNKQLIWLGAVERQTTIRKIADAKYIVIPSIFETFSFVALEAASLGKAIIITEGTGASYLFTHGINAWIVPPDANKLAKAMIYLQQNPELCVQLGHNARQMVSEAFEEERILKERLYLYTRTIEDQKNHKLIKPDLGFLNNYTTSKRKAYYKLRVVAKKIIKGR